jgi:ATP synthase subunit 6
LASLFSFFKESSTHLVPSGTPIGLIRFIVLIELVRQLIRPITLGVRLAANLTAGHLLLQLLSSIRLRVTVMSQLPLLVLELLVAVVQGYVFVLLLTLYLSEV